MEPALAIQEFLDYVVSGLIGEVAETTVSRTVHGTKTAYRIQVSPDEAGLVIGKHGKTISAIRGLVLASAEKHRFDADVEVVKESL